MKANSLLDILNAIELEIGLYLDEEKTKFDSKKEEITYRDQLVKSISELNQELTNLVYQIEINEPRTQGYLKNFKLSSRFAINYMLKELTQFDPLYSRFTIGFKKIKELKYYFH